MTDKTIVNSILDDYADKYGTKSLKDLLLNRKEMYEDIGRIDLNLGLQVPLSRQKSTKVRAN